MNHEEMLKKTIEKLGIYNPKLKLEIRERTDKFTVIPSMVNPDGTSTEEVLNDEVEITIFRDGKRLFTSGYFSGQPELRQIAFERMLQTIILSGLVNHPVFERGK